MDRVNAEIIEGVIDYIESHLDDKLDLNQIAMAVGYSKFYLHRQFSESTGMTIHDYVLRRRLTEAAKLLVLSDVPIIEIAFRCGYESQQAFSVVFKLMYKMSPAQYRSNGDFYALQLPWKLDNHIGKNMLRDVNLRLASMADLDSWIDLMHLVIDGYPHMNESEYHFAIRKTILEKHAVVIYDGDLLIGAAAFSVDSGSIDFLGVHPLYRRFGIHNLLLKALTDEYLLNTEISMTTFRDGDKADTGYRNLLKEFGFVERELLTEYEYPTQRMVYIKYDNREEEL